MKQYLIDELRLPDYNKILEYLNENLKPSKIAGIYHLILPPSLLTKIQQQHTDCAPFYFAIAVSETKVTAEFLVRASKKIKCDCIQYADDTQKSWLMGYIDKMLTQLDINI